MKAIQGGGWAWGRNGWYAPACWQWAGNDSFSGDGFHWVEVSRSRLDQGQLGGRPRAKPGSEWAKDSKKEREARMDTSPRKTAVNTSRDAGGGTGAKIFILGWSKRMGSMWNWGRQRGLRYKVVVGEIPSQCSSFLGERSWYLSKRQGSKDARRWGMRRVSGWLGRLLSQAPLEGIPFFLFNLTSLCGAFMFASSSMHVACHSTHVEIRGQPPVSVLPSMASRCSPLCTSG